MITFIKMKIFSRNKRKQKKKTAETQIEISIFTMQKMSQVTSMLITNFF